MSSSSLRAESLVFKCQRAILGISLTGVYKTRTGSDRIGLTKSGSDRIGLTKSGPDRTDKLRTGSDRIDKIRTGSDRINKTWIGLRPIDKTRTGSEKNQIAINFRQKSHVMPQSKKEVCRCSLCF